jgi:hypothetical protein
LIPAQTHQRRHPGGVQSTRGMTAGDHDAVQQASDGPTKFDPPWVSAVTHLVQSTTPVKRQKLATE